MDSGESRDREVGEADIADFGVTPKKQRPTTNASAEGETCDQYFDRLMTFAKEQGQTDTDKKRSRWKKWIAPHVGQKRPQDLTRNDVENIRDALDAAILLWKRNPTSASKIGDAVSGKTAMNVWSAVTSTMKASTSSKRREFRVLEGRPNPCLGVEPPGDRDSRQPRRKTFLYAKDAAAVLACGDVPLEWREVYALA